MVRRPVPQSTSEVGSSAQANSRQISTPPGGSDSSSSGQLNTPSTSSSSRSPSCGTFQSFDPDEPLPSIETESVAEATLTTDCDAALRARSPSFSITPPSSEQSRSLTASSGNASSYFVVGSQVSSLDGRIAALGLSGDSTPNQSIPRRETSQSPTSALSPPTTPARTPNSGHASPASPGFGVTANLANVNLGRNTLGSGSPGQTTHLSPRSPSPNLSMIDAVSSPGSAHRRRSGSNIDQTPHSVADEEPPNERFHDREVQQQLSNSRRLVEDLVRVLQSSSLHTEQGSQIRRLYLKGVTLSQYANPSDRIVGLVGNSGVGKSSLLNSLLDYKGFSRTSSSGTACTSVATEYHYHEDRNFAFEVDYFTQDELREQFTELLQSYRAYHLHDHDDNNTTAEDHADLQAREKAAIDLFRAAFRDHLVQNERFLLDDPEAEVLETLITWARDIDLPYQRTNNMVPGATFDDAEEISYLLMGLTSDPVDATEPSIWPFIRKIRVYLNAYILSKGLVLVDLPGLRDLNSARLKITERYLLHCDEIFALCDIARAITDVSIKDVFELARRASLSKITIVCTKSDAISPEEAEHDFGGTIRSNIQRMREQVRNIRGEEDRIQAEINDITGDGDLDDDELDEEARREHYQLNTKLLRTQTRLDKAKFELEKYVVTTRNQKVTKDLEASYPKEYPTVDISVFCVSNSLYWRKRYRPKAKALPLLELSGVLEIRRHCLALVAEGQLRAATEYVTNAIPAFLGSIELWIQAGGGDLSAERKLAIRRALDGIEQELEAMRVSTSNIHGVGRRMHRQFTEQIMPLMARRSDRWSQAAVQATIDWAGWNHATYTAFCKNYGTHMTAATRVYRSWNDEAMEAMVTSLRTPWQEFRQNALRFQERIPDTIDNIFDGAISLSVPNDLPRNALRTLRRTLRHNQAMLVTQVEDLCGEFERGLSILWTDVASGIRSSYMGQAMEQSYNICRQEQGLGSDQRRKATMRRGFGDDQLFPTIRRQFRAGFSELSRDLDTKIEQAVTRHLEVVQRDVDTLRNENVVLESESQPEFRRRLETTTAEIRERLNEAIAVYARLNSPTP